MRTPRGRGRRRGRTRASPNTSGMPRPNWAVGARAATAAAPEVRPPLKSRRLETQLMMILGAGFGFGRRAGRDPAVRGPCAGPDHRRTGGRRSGRPLVTVWVVGIRGLLHDRAVLDRWVTDVAATLRSTVEERVATRVLAAETALTSDWPLATKPRARRPRIASRKSTPNCVSTQSRPPGPRRSGPPGAGAAAGAGRGARRAVRLASAETGGRRSRHRPVARAADIGLE